MFSKLSTIRVLDTHRQTRRAMGLFELIQVSRSRRAKNRLGHRNVAQRRCRAFYRVCPPKSCQGEDGSPRVDCLSYFRPSRVCLESKSIR